MTSLQILIVLLSASGGSAQCQPEDVLNRYLHAFNTNDAASVAPVLAEDVSWFTVSGGQMIAEMSGRKALTEWLENYFVTTPGVRSEFDFVASDGCLASVRERARWTRDGQPAEQTALATYQVRDGTIKRVWYFLDTE